MEFRTHLIARLCWHGMPLLVVLLALATARVAAEPFVSSSGCNGGAYIAEKPRFTPDMSIEYSKAVTSEINNIEYMFLENKGIGTDNLRYHQMLRGAVEVLRKGKKEKIDFTVMWIYYHESNKYTLYGTCRGDAVPTGGMSTSVYPLNEKWSEARPLNHTCTPESDNFDSYVENFLQVDYSSSCGDDFVESLKNLENYKIFRESFRSYMLDECEYALGANKCGARESSDITKSISITPVHSIMRENYIDGGSIYTGDRAIELILDHDILSHSLSYAGIHGNFRAVNHPTLTMPWIMLHDAETQMHVLLEYHYAKDLSDAPEHRYYTIVSSIDPIQKKLTDTVVYPPKYIGGEVLIHGKIYDCTHEVSEDLEHYLSNKYVVAENALHIGGFGSPEEILKVANDSAYNKVRSVFYEKWRTACSVHNSGNDDVPV